jgi:hypothetical protein
MERRASNDPVFLQVPQRALQDLHDKTTNRRENKHHTPRRDVCLRPAFLSEWELFSSKKDAMRE